MSGGGDILLVEDDQDAVVLTRRALERSGIGVRLAVARDGAEALDYLFGRAGVARGGAADPPDLVLLDINLPRVPGTEILRRIRETRRTSHVPVIVVSSGAEPHEGRGSRADGYIRKPIDSARLLAITRRLGLSRLETHPRPPRAGP